MIKKNMDETNTGYMKHLGGLLLKKVSDELFEFNVTVRDIHLNTGKIAHGGFIASIADTGMGTAAHQIAGNKRCVTISLNMKYISPGKLNDNLKGTVRIKKKTKSMVFLECYLECKGKIIASATGIWKILQRKLPHAGLS